MTWIGAFGGYFLKKASSFNINMERKAFMLRLLSGVFLYGVSAILNIVALKFLPYTVVFPLTAITYIWTMLISYLLLKEQISMRKIIGVLLIVTGAFVLVG
nr:EamA family transporter [Planococcus halocryophilus]